MPHDHEKAARTIPRFLIATSLLTVIVSISVLIGVTYWLTDKANKLERVSNTQLVRTAYEASVTKLEFFVGDNSYWDTTYRAVIERDAEGALDNLGVVVTEDESVDGLALLSNEGEPVFAYALGYEDSSPDLFMRSAFEQLRASLPAFDPEEHHVISGVVSNADGLFLHSLSFIRPYELEGIDTQSLPIMMMSQRIDTAFARQFAKNLNVSEIEFTVEEPAADDRLGTFALRAASGEALAWFFWTLPRPGDELRAAATPIIAAMVVLLITASFISAKIATRQASVALSAFAEAKHDSLTGLLNRRGLDLAFEHLSRSEALQNCGAVLYLDLNGFKKLNDRAGHAAGDIALEITAKRLAQAVRSQDLVSRVGGDEFAIILQDEAPELLAQEIAERVQILFSGGMEIEGARWDVRPAVGVAIKREDEPWAETLARADEDMLAHKPKNRTTPSRDVAA